MSHELSVNPASAENEQPAFAKVRVPSIDDPASAIAKFKPPTRTIPTDRPIKTYRRLVDPRSLPGLQPVVSDYSQSSNLEAHHEAEQDDYTESETDADDEDAESGDSQPFRAQALQLAEKDTALQRELNTITELLCMALVSILPMYRQVFTSAFESHATSTSSVPDEDEERLEAMRGNDKLAEALHVIERFFGATHEILQCLGHLLQSPALIHHISKVTGDLTKAHRYIALFHQDIWRILSDDDNDFDNSDGQYDAQETDRATSIDDSAENDIACSDKEESVPRVASLSGPDETSQRSLGKMALDAILCDTPVKQGDATSGSHVAFSDAAKENQSHVVTLEPWMIDSAPTAIKAKSKRSKRKKKAATHGNDVDASARVLKEGKSLPSTTKCSTSGLKASDSIASAMTSEESTAEITVRTAFATKNIFDQLKRVGDAMSASGESPDLALTSQSKGSAEVGDSPKSRENEVIGGVSLETNAVAVVSEVIRSWSNCEVDFPSSAAIGDGLHSGASLISDKALVLETSRIANPSVFISTEKADVRSQDRLEGMDRLLHARSPGTPSASENKARNPLGESVTTAVHHSGLLPPPAGSEPQIRSTYPTYNQSLSMKDIREGATIEPHPTKGTECIVLREPRERPDYSCTIFVAG